MCDWQCKCFVCDSFDLDDVGYFLHLLDFCAVANFSLNKRKPTTLGVVFRFTPKLKDTEVSHRPSILPPLGPTPIRVIQLLLLQLINFFDTLLLQKIYSNLTWCCTSRCVVTPTHHQSLTWSKSPPLKHLCLPSSPHLQFPEMGGGGCFILLCFVLFVFTVLMVLPSSEAYRVGITNSPGFQSWFLHSGCCISVCSMPRFCCCFVFVFVLSPEW